MKIKDTALVVIDITNECCSKKCEWKDISFKKIRKMIPKLKKFIDDYREKGGNVVLINCVPWKKKYLAKNLVELYKDSKCRYYSSGKSGFNEKFFQIVPDKKDYIITKNTYDAFSNPKLDKLLKKLKTKYVVICGVFGDGCVDATIKNGFSKGYNFIILKDLIETTDLPIRQKLQKMMKEFTWPTMYGKTIDSKDFN